LGWELAAVVVEDFGELVGLVAAVEEVGFDAFRDVSDKVGDGPYT